MSNPSLTLDTSVMRLKHALEAGELPPGQDGPARDALKRYEERVRREGREPYSEWHKQKGKEAEELEGYFDPTPRMTAEQRAEIDNLVRDDENPAEAEARIFNAKQFAHDYQQSDEEVSNNYPLYFLRFTHEEMGVPSATDVQVRGYLQGQYGVKKRASQAYADAALKDVPVDEMIRTVVPELQKDAHWNPRKEGEITGLMREGHGYLSKKLALHRGFIRNAVQSMQVHMGAKEGEALLSWEELGEEVLKIPSEKRDLVLQAIVATGAPEEDKKHWVQKLGENLWRGSVSFATGLPKNLTREFLLRVNANVDLLEVPVGEVDPVKWASSEVFSSTYRDVYAGEQHGAKEAADMVIGLFVDPPKKRRLTEEEKAKVRAEYDRLLEAMDINRDLNDIADGTIDPARSEHAMVQGLYSFTRSLPQGLSMVLPYAWPAGIVMTYGQFAEDNNHRFRREQSNLSREQRHYLANAAAPWQTMASFLSDRLLLGRLPGFGAWLRQPVTTFATQLRRAPLMVPKGAVEFGSENLQNLTPYFVQEAVSRLDKDMPGVPWEMAMRGIRAGQEELAATVVWSTLVYHGAGSIMDVGAYRSQAARPVLMEAAGFSQEAASRISLAAKKGDWRGVEMMMRAEHDAGRIETNGENLVRQREAAAKLLREEAQRRGVAVAELEKIGALPVLSRVRDGRYQLAFDDGSFGYYANAQEAVGAMQDFAVHRGMRMTEEMREVFGKIQEDMKAGREVALQFSPEQMMAQRAVETGLATKKQMQERGQAGEALLGNAVTGDTGTDSVHGNGGGEAASGVGSDADFGATSLDVVSHGVAGEVNSEARVAEDGDYEATLHMAEAMAPEAADAEVAGQILGISRTAFKEGVARTTIRLYEGATPLTLIEEKLEGDASVMMRNPGKRAWLLEALRDVERKTGTTLFRTGDDGQVTDNDIKEAWSHLGQGYFVGRSKKGDDQMLASWKEKGFRQVYADILSSKAGPAMQAYGTFFRSVWRRGAELNGMRRAGTLDSDLEAVLRRSLGMGEMSDSSRAVQSDSITGASQESDPVIIQTMDAVSITFSMLGGEGDAATPKQTPLDRANDFLRREVVNKPLTTRDGLTATVSNASASKMTSGSAVKKSASPEAHLAAISKFSELYRSGRIAETKPDRNLDPNIKAIHRVTATMALDDKRHSVKFTVKEFALSKDGARIYSIEALEIEDASEGKRDAADIPKDLISSPQSEAQDTNSTKASEDQSLSLIPDGQQAMGTGGVDPRILKAFGPDAKLDGNGLPIPPRTLTDNDPLLQPTIDKKTVILDEDHVLVRNGMLKAGVEISRKQLRQAIVSFFINSSKPVPDGDKPVVTAMGGGGGAGKSRMLNTLEASGLAGLAGAAKVNPDDIAEIIPEYRRIVESGDSRAAETVYREATQISGVLMDTLLALPPAQRRNIIYDSTLSRRDSALRHFSKWRGAGYGVNLVGITLDPKEAMIRAAVRAKREGRWVPYERIAEAHQGFNQALKEYLDLVDEARVFENDLPDAPTLIATKKRSASVTVENLELWNKIDDRGVLK